MENNSSIFSDFVEKWSKELSLLAFKVHIPSYHKEEQYARCTAAIASYEKPYLPWGSTDPCTITQMAWRNFNQKLT